MVFLVSASRLVQTVDRAGLATSSEKSSALGDLLAEVGPACFAAPSYRFCSVPRITLIRSADPLLDLGQLADLLLVLRVTGAQLDLGRSPAPARARPCRRCSAP